MVGRILAESLVSQAVRVRCGTANLSTALDGQTLQSCGWDSCLSNLSFAAWLGLTPRQNSSGGKTKLGAISKRGDVTLRTLLIHGTRSALRLTAGKTDRKSVWAEALKERRCANVAAVVLAAKNARILWAMRSRGTEYPAAS